ncbi:hypothetical protein HN371_29335 [Candidatus Poribacteria bacterium]|jgi:hypothetical protein|nr:hypothetical protein [Candidatus Poribacteria bacterium]MBT7096150.1 hypothetical protein [Candidatus Poribacteria bacterium]
MGARQGEDGEQWLAAERDHFETCRDCGSLYESPLACSALGINALVHQIEDWVPDAAPSWVWPAISTFLDMRRFSTLPRAGGTLDQDARLMDAFRILDSAMGDMTKAEQMLRDAQSNSGWKARK